MPYNNTAIPPPEEVTGSAALPLARVKRILQLDDDISACSANGAFAITVATEMFIRYLAEQSLNVVKSERKPRRNIQYKDVANAVARIDNLEFLTDVVPKTVTYREYKQQKAGRAARKQELLQSGQRTLDSSNAQQRRPNGMTDVRDGPHDDQGHPMEVTTNGHSQRGLQLSPPQTNGNSNLIFQHYQPNGDAHQGEPQDVEMH